ncbi:flagellin [Aestuariirhabdus sp. Z084]|uniref:flagellin n=1 Tax=Aestuariirhabdus haliotis TaxID=2918751 RepID=UPI00201B424B|nr:flagellin [Aestuariirhabdus haliotis]MCL6414451.1 flagellin [Aestuariirhabdus haliotis]MCL6418567.1 flagellin [Aestuariirhabdus haliotis]
MALTVQTNVASLNTQRNLTNSSDALDVSLQRLSTGFRINSAKDDAAGLQISDRLTSQINGLNQATRNANDGISLSQTAEGALQQSTDILQRMRDLSIQSANGSNDSTDRAALQKEVAALQAELTRIADTTTFGGRKLLDGSFGTSDFQVGAQAYETIGITLNSASATDIGSYQVQGEGTVAGLATAAGTFTADSFDINAGGKVFTTQGILAQDTAREISNKINATESGVKATARTDANLALAVGGAATIDLSIGVYKDDTTTLATAGTPGTADTLIDLVGVADAETVVNAVNNAGGSGLTATLQNDGSIRLTAADGSSVSVTGANAAGGATATLGTYDPTDGSTVLGTTVAVTAASAVATGAVQLDSPNTYSIAAAGGGDPLEFLSAATGALSNAADIDISTAYGAQQAIFVVDNAIQQIDGQRADLGAVQNRFENTISNLQSISENASAARSRIKDTDYAAETSELAKNQVLQQAGTSVLAQANQLPQAVLSLLG